MGKKKENLINLLPNVSTFKFASVSLEKEECHAPGPVLRPHTSSWEYRKAHAVSVGVIALRLSSLFGQPHRSL